MCVWDDVCLCVNGCACESVCVCERPCERGCVMVAGKCGRVPGSLPL